MKQDVKIIAHRGYSSLYPDNSLEGFEKAAAIGASMIETDIREARDGSLICSHDKTSGPALPFSDALAFAKDKIPLLLDLKQDDPDFHVKLAQEIKRHNMEDGVIIGVRSLAQAKHIKELLPNVQLLGFLKPNDLPAFYQLGGNIGRLWESDINEQNVQLAKSGDHPVFVMTGSWPKGIVGVGETTPERIRKIMLWDVQGILVNDPKLALKLRDEPAKPAARPPNSPRA